MNEITKNWQHLSADESRLVALSYAIPTKKSPEHWTRLLDLGNPDLVMGYNQEEQLQYCRFTPDSLKVMTVIIRNYLN